VPINKEMMATIFWDSKGILMVNFKERYTTVNGMYYESVLYKLRDVIKEKRCGMLSRGVKLLHDNAPVHTAAVRECGFIELNHRPHSPDLAPQRLFPL
jgi:histone-lysine N-methyltransferase SETMAR